MTASTEVFSRYPNRVFIETGSYHGDGIQQALDAGFEIVVSMEVNRDLWEYTQNRFAGYFGVDIFWGDSREILPYVINIIEEPCTIWLDSHSPNNLPLLEELEIIKNHHIKTHTILIDDLRLWTKAEHGYDTESLKEILLSINPDYEIRLDGCLDFPNDILVAVPR